MSNQKQNLSESINQRTKRSTDLVGNFLCHLKDFPTSHRIQNALPCLQDPDPILSHLKPEEFYLKYIEFINIDFLTRNISMTLSIEIIYLKFNLHYHRHENLKFRG